MLHFLSALRSRQKTANDVSPPYLPGNFASHSHI